MPSTRRDGHAHVHAHDAHGHAHEHAHTDEHSHAAGAVATDEDHPSHAHAHGKFTAREARQAKRLALVLALITGFFAFELAGAIAARSVVLEADALHLLMDVLALSMSLLAMRIAIRRPTPRFTFGMRRAEPVAAIFNSLLVLGATFEIVREGVAELGGTGHPRPGIMLIVAAAALVVNGLSAWLLHGALHDHGHGHDHAHDAEAPKKLHGHALNLRGAWLHLLGDALGSIAALVAAIVIKYGGPVSVRRVRELRGGGDPDRRRVPAGARRDAGAAGGGPAARARRGRPRGDPRVRGHRRGSRPARVDARRRARRDHHARSREDRGPDPRAPAFARPPGGVRHGVRHRAGRVVRRRVRGRRRTRLEAERRSGYWHTLSMQSSVEGHSLFVVHCGAACVALSQ